MSDSEEEEICDPFVNCDGCDYIINMDKYGYYILYKDTDKDTDKESEVNVNELVLCEDCYYSDLRVELKEKGWKCDDDSING